MVQGGLGCLGGRKGGGAQNFALFFPPPPENSFFSSLSGGRLVEFWWCLKHRGPAAPKKMLKTAENFKLDKIRQKNTMGFRAYNSKGVDKNGAKCNMGFGRKSKIHPVAEGLSRGRIPDQVGLGRMKVGGSLWEK